VKEDLKKIVWIASYPKSGNTWFRVLLSNLSGDLASPVSINQLQSTPIASSRKIFDDLTGTASSDLTNDEIDLIRPDLYRWMALKANDTIFKKVHDAWTLNSRGEPVFPPDVTKAVIYIIRNPLDIAVSYSYHINKNISETIGMMNDKENALCSNPDKLYNQLRQKLNGWSEHVRSWVDYSGLPVITLRYEDMLDDPFTQFRKVFDFIGMLIDNERLEKAIAFSGFEVLNSQEQKEGFKEKPIRMNTFFRSGKSGEWEKYLSAEQVKIISEQNHELMVRFGYLNEKQVFLSKNY